MKQRFKRLNLKIIQIIVSIILKDVSVAYNSLHCPEWYQLDIMKLIIGTFQDYTTDIRKNINPISFEQYIVELEAKSLLLYWQSFKNKNAIYKMQNAPPKLKSDHDRNISFFAQFKNLQQTTSTFEDIENIIKLITSDRRTLIIELYSLIKHYPEVPLAFFEAVISKKDDLSKEFIIDIMNECKKKENNEIKPTISSYFKSFFY